MALDGPSRSRLELHGNGTYGSHGTHMSHGSRRQALTPKRHPALRHFFVVEVQDKDIASRSRHCHHQVIKDVPMCDERVLLFERIGGTASPDHLVVRVAQDQARTIRAMAPCEL